MGLPQGPSCPTARTHSSPGQGCRHCVYELPGLGAWPCSGALPAPRPAGLAMKLGASLSALPQPRTPTTPPYAPPFALLKTRSARAEAQGQSDRSAFLYWRADRCWAGQDAGEQPGRARGTCRQLTTQTRGAASARLETCTVHDLRPSAEGPNKAQQPQEGEPQKKASVPFTAPATGQMVRRPRDSEGTGARHGGPRGDRWAGAVEGKAEDSSLAGSSRLPRGARKSLKRKNKTPKEGIVCVENPSLKKKEML